MDFGASRGPSGHPLASFWRHFFLHFSASSFALHIYCVHLKVNTAGGLQHAARHYHRLVVSLSKVALFHFKLSHCVGVRLGHGVASISEMVCVGAAVVFHWHADEPKDVAPHYDTVGYGRAN